MNRKFYTILPITIFLIILLIDKITYFPSFQNCCLKKGLEIFFQSSLNNEFPMKERIAESIRKDKRIAFNFGSSISYGYFFTESPEYQNIVNKTSNEKNHSLKKWDIINFATPGATLISHYIRLCQMLERGLKPNLIMIELAPNSFNAKSPWYKAEIKEAIPFDFVVQHIFEIPIEHLKIMLISRLFTLSRFKLGKPDAELNIAKDYFKKFQYNYGQGAYSENIVPKSFKIGQEMPYNEFTNQFLVEVLKLNFTNYEIDKNLKVYFYLIKNLADKQGIPIVFWHPSLHPQSKKIIQDVTSSSDWLLFEKEIEDKGIMFFNLNSNDTDCDEFLDSMHMGISCFAKNFSYILEKIENEKK